jgi:hypothetical protein
MALPGEVRALQEGEKNFSFNVNPYPRPVFILGVLLNQLEDIAAVVLDSGTPP